MEYIVSLIQYSFVLGRSMVDNVINLQELLHSMSLLKGRKWYMVLKLDLEKAYDRMEWAFVKDTLEGSWNSYSLLYFLFLDGY